jgi:hypothetical protein
MSFICPVASSLDPTELTQTYSNEGKQLLPSTISPASDRDSTGLLKQEVVKSWIQSLERTNVLPSVQAYATDGAGYVKRVRALLENAKTEYCFYDARYRSSLQRLFTAIRQAYFANTAESQQIVQRYLGLSKELNRKVNDLVQIMNVMTEKMLASSNTLQGEIKAFNDRIQAQRDKLQEQNRVIQSNEATMKLQKEMVNYTEEKARYSDNLLSLYSFLNVVALGLLVYLYRASDSYE